MSWRHSRLSWLETKTGQAGIPVLQVLLSFVGVEQFNSLALVVLVGSRNHTPRLAIAIDQFDGGVTPSFVHQQLSYLIAQCRRHCRH